MTSDDRLGPQRVAHPWQCVGRVSDTRSTDRMVKCPVCGLFILIGMADESPPRPGMPFACPLPEGCGRLLELTESNHLPGCRVVSGDHP